MSNGNNVFERLLKLWVKIMMMVMDGARKAEEVAEWLQVVVARTDFATLLATPPREASVKTEPDGGWAQEWARFYHEVFGLEVDFTGVEFAEAKFGFGWAVFVPKGLTLNVAWQACQKLFPTNSYLGDDLDRAVPTNDRTSAEPYAKRLRNRVEGDEENKNLSANTLAQREIQGITLLERLLLELWYFWKTGGGHLDLVNVTLCAGSRSADGGVPSAHWGDYRFRVYYDRPDGARGGLRARSAV